MSDVRAELLQQIKDKAVVHGKVTLSSGLEADYYVDLRRVTLDGEAAPLVGQVLLDLTEDLEFDAVGGLTMGADPVAAAVLRAAPLGLPVLPGGRDRAGAHGDPAHRVERPVHAEIRKPLPCHLTPTDAPDASNCTDVGLLPFPQQPQ